MFIRRNCDLLRLRLMQKLWSRLPSFFLLLLFLVAVSGRTGGSFSCNFRQFLWQINRNGALRWEHVEYCLSTIKNTSPLPQCLWPPNLVGWWLTLRSSHPSREGNLWSCGPARSRHKLKIYPHNQNAYGNHTRQDGNLPWQATIHKVSRAFHHVALQDHVTN